MQLPLFLRALEATLNGLIGLLILFHGNKNVYIIVIINSLFLLLLLLSLILSLLLLK